MSINPENIIHWFRYHPPADEEIVGRYKRVRDAGAAFAMTVWAETPASADQTAAIRKIREAVMTANAAIACGGK